MCVCIYVCIYIYIYIYRERERERYYDIILYYIILLCSNRRVSKLCSCFNGCLSYVTASCFLLPANTHTNHVYTIIVIIVHFYAALRTGSPIRLLRALSIRLSDVGYCQSLNFVVATLINVFPDDEAGRV